ncbi:hypothetical protein BKI52_15635 [marine bacterium AO1-C]|nr:hypothetical protein BKI52_15635 [marine bacterium AO1-C]
MKEKLTPANVYQVMKSLFPALNDYVTASYEEELYELNTFGIKHKIDFEALMIKHKETILEIDREPPDEQHIEWYRQDNTIIDLEHKLALGYWFAFPGLIRLGLELEFGEKYQKFAEQRDRMD